MSITIHIQLLSGDVIDFPVRARGGKVKYLTIEKRMCEKVIDELKLDSENYRVKFIHDDDEEKRAAIRTQRWGDSPYQLGFEARLALESALTKQRTYQDGDVVHALVEEFHTKQAWADLNDE